MPIEQDVDRVVKQPWVTWSLAALITVVSVAAFFDLKNVVFDFGLIPAKAARYGGLTFITSFFLHGGIFHLLGNLYFLMVFGDNVEEWLGRRRYVLLLICASLAGDMLHVLYESGSEIPCIGASGGISGVIVFYALRFPRARLGFLIRIYLWFKWIRMPAYAMLVIWFAMQLFGAWTQIAGISNVSSLAHIGGAAVGFIFWLVMRKAA
jgi:membrane associated rhomboid family serine protease